MSSAVALNDLERRISERITPEGSRAVTMRAGNVVFSNLEDVMNFAKLMAIGGISVPKHLRGNVGACLAVTIQAVEWNFSPYSVANKSYSVNDRLAYESQLIQAVILARAPIQGRLRFEFEGEGPERTCTASANLPPARPGDLPLVVSYTTPKIRDIKTKNSPLWTADPDQQLTYYSGRALCRRYFPDVIMGILAQDEPPEGPAVNDRINPLRDDVAAEYEVIDGPSDSDSSEPAEAHAPPAEAGVGSEAAPSEPTASESTPSFGEADEFYQAGYAHGSTSGASRSNCPYRSGTRRLRWMVGFEDGKNAPSDP